MSFPAAQRPDDSLRTQARQDLDENGGIQPRRLAASDQASDRELLFSLADDLAPATAKLVIVRLAAHGKVDGATAIDCLNALGLRSA